jgi:hypothetical protein
MNPPAIEPTPTHSLRLHKLPALTSPSLASPGPSQTLPIVHTVSTSDQLDAGFGAAAVATTLAEMDKDISIAAIMLNLLLLFGFVIYLRKNDERLNIIGRVTLTCYLIYLVLSHVSPSAFPGPSGYTFYFPLLVIERAAGIGVSWAGFSFLIMLVWYYFFDSTLPKALPHASKQIDVLIAQSQRRTWLRRVVFVLDARMGVSAEQFDLMKKYRLGRVIVYDSLRRQRQNKLTRAHLEMALQRKSGTICLWREEIRGFFRRIYYLIRSLVSFLIGFLFIRITISKLLRGAHIESKSLDRILEAKIAIETGATDLNAYLIAAETFDGREDLFEPT